MEHKAKYCDIKECRDEAEYWVGDIQGKSTFYLCGEHRGAIENEDGQYNFIENGIIKYREVGVYSCSEDCKVCN